MHTIPETLELRRILKSKYPLFLGKPYGRYYPILKLAFLAC